jgi:KAP family P-loop domain
VNDLPNRQTPSDSAPFMPLRQTRFYLTPGWYMLARILTRNDGVYGLHGPRGSGKTTLMRHAVDEAIANCGMGLWFPCSSESDPMEFLSALCDTLADAVEQRFVADNFWSRTGRRLRPALIIAVAAPVVADVVVYAIHGLNAKGAVQPALLAVLPSWLWIVVGVALFVLLADLIARIIWDGRPAGRLVRVATGLRNRVRYTEDLTHGSEVDLSGGSVVASAWKTSEQRSLSERPATVPALVFEFRRLAALIVTTTRKPLVIGIDELDKVSDRGAVVKLLQDVRGVLEIPNVHFLVALSEESAAALNLGSLQVRGRNEFNSSFSTVVSLPPLSAEQAAALLGELGLTVTIERARILSLLSAGNVREMIRLAEGSQLPPRPGHIDEDHWLIMKTIEAEAAALLGEIINIYSAQDATGDMMVSIWNKLPSAAFSSAIEFVELSRNAIRDSWQPGSTDATWEDQIRESWQRLLIRFFVSGSVIAPSRITGDSRKYSPQDMSGLRDVLIMATQSSAVARAMLMAAMGPNFDRTYTAPPGIRLLPESAK